MEKTIRFWTWTHELSFDDRVFLANHLEVPTSVGTYSVRLHHVPEMDLRHPLSNPYGLESYRAGRLLDEWPFPIDVLRVDGEGLEFRIAATQAWVGGDQEEDGGEWMQYPPSPSIVIPRGQWATGGWCWWASSRGSLSPGSLGTVTTAPTGTLSLTGCGWRILPYPRSESYPVTSEREWPVHIPTSLLEEKITR